MWEMGRGASWLGRRGVFVVLAALCVLGTSVPPAGAGQTSSYQVVRGTRAGAVPDGPAWAQEAAHAWRGGKKKRAVDLVRRALRRMPMSPAERVVAEHILCVGQTELGEPDRAIRHCDEALKLAHRDRWLHLNNRGNARIALGDTDGAIRDYEQALASLSSALPGPRDMGEAVPQNRRSVIEANLLLAARNGEERVEDLAGAPRVKAQPAGDEISNEGSLETGEPGPGPASSRP